VSSQLTNGSGAISRNATPTRHTEPPSITNAAGNRTHDECREQTGTRTQVVEFDEAWTLYHLPGTHVRTTAVEQVSAPKKPNSGISMAVLYFQSFWRQPSPNWMIRLELFIYCRIHGASGFHPKLSDSICNPMGWEEVSPATVDNLHQWGLRCAGCQQDIGVIRMRRESLGIGLGASVSGVWSESGK